MIGEVVTDNNREESNINNIQETIIQEERKLEQIQTTEDERHIITNQNVDILLKDGDVTYSIVWKNTEIPTKALGTHTLEYDIENEIVLPTSNIETLEKYRKKQNSLTGYSFLMNVYLDIGHQCMLMMQNGYTVRNLISNEIIVIDDRFVCFPNNIDVGMETVWINDLLGIIIQLLIPNISTTDIEDAINNEDENTFDQMLATIKGTPLYYSLKTAKELNEFVYI
jgi:hypothetical protein